MILILRENREVFIFGFWLFLVFVLAWIVGGCRMVSAVDLCIGPLAAKRREMMVGRGNFKRGAKG